MQGPRLSLLSLSVSPNMYRYAPILDTTALPVSLIPPQKPVDGAKKPNGLKRPFPRDGDDCAVVAAVAEHRSSMTRPTIYEAANRTDGNDATALADVAVPLLIGSMLYICKVGGKCKKH